jgi:hypothetical protein
VGADHPAYRHEVTLSAEVRAELTKDVQA